MSFHIHRVRGLRAGGLRIGAVLAVVAAAVLFAGCETLGWSSPFSDGNAAFDEAKRDWANGDKASALQNAARATRRDDKHYPAYQFLVQNYAQAMVDINAQLATLTAAGASTADLAEAVEIYTDLKWFVNYLDNDVDPRVVTFQNTSVEIPLTDYDPILAEVGERGLNLAFEEAAPLLAADDLEAANDVLERVVRQFTENDSETQAAAKLRISDLFADRAEALLTAVSVESIALANEALEFAADFEETERVTALVAQVQEVGAETILAEAERIAGAGTVDALKEALQLAFTATEYMARQAIVERVYPLAERLARVYWDQITVALRQYDGSRSSGGPLFTTYNSFLDVLVDWDRLPALYPDALKGYSELLEAWRYRVLVAVNDQLSADARDWLIGELRDELGDNEDRSFWFFDEDDMDRANDLARGFTSSYRTLTENAAVDVYWDRNEEAHERVNSIGPGADLGSLQQFYVDYVVNVTATGSQAQTAVRERTARETVSAAQRDDGRIDTDAATITILRLAKSQADSRNDPSRFTDALEDAGIARVWFDIPVTYTYQTATAQQNFSYEISVVRTADGRTLDTRRFAHNVAETGREVLSAVRCEVGTIQAHLERQIREVGTARVSASAVREGLRENLDAAALAAVIERN